MKTHPQRRPGRGFTLVELLVVISIIIVLAAMSFGAAQLAMNRARKMRAQADTRAIEQSMEAFFTQYGRFPNVNSQGGEIQTTGDAGVELLTILLGKEQTGTTMQNSRQIPFLSGVRDGKRNRDGIIYSQSGEVQGLYDPWGNPYNILMDDDFDDEIRDPIKSGAVVRNRKVIVYTLGNDKRPGTSDDVKTWSN